LIGGQTVAASIIEIMRAAGDVPAKFQLLDGITAADVGIWVPFAPFSNGTFEVSSTGTATIALKGSNGSIQPPNGWTVTVGGSAGTGDVLTLTITCPLLFNGNATASYTVLAGDTTTTIATGLAAAMNAVASTPPTGANVNLGSQLSNLQYGQEISNVAGQFQVTSSSAVITVIWQAFLNTPVSLQKTLSAGATETLTIAQYDSGAGNVIAGCTFTASGEAVFNQPCAWIKAYTTAYSSGTISANVWATTP
jgi:hypothetical protein